VFLNRLATIDNLEARGISFPHDTGLRVLCNEEVESVTHLFMSCKVVFQIWQKCLDWIGIVTAIPNDTRVHFAWFIGLLYDN